MKKKRWTYLPPGSTGLLLQKIFPPGTIYPLHAFTPRIATAAVRGIGAIAVQPGAIWRNAFAFTKSLVEDSVLTLADVAEELSQRPPPQCLLSLCEARGGDDDENKRFHCYPGGGWLPHRYYLLFVDDFSLCVFFVLLLLSGSSSSGIQRRVCVGCGLSYGTHFRIFGLSS
jgi:hypothetical protein